MQKQSFIYRAFGAPIEQISLETMPFSPVGENRMRVAMIAAPVNPSDLIPIGGAYAHRITLPAVVGYEGIGRVISAPPAYSSLIGRRVLPLRGDGTWQAYVDCDPALAVPVPEEIGDLAGCRAYINPLAALTMLDRWPVAGKRVLLGGAGSMCSELLGVWARQEGAAEVCGIYRSESRLQRLVAAGIEPVSIHDPDAIKSAAGKADLVFDALGGPIGSAVLEAMRPGTSFIGYGLLSGRNISSFGREVRYHRFHLRDSLATMTADGWQAQFRRLWPRLDEALLPPVKVFPLSRWREALEEAALPGGSKSVLAFGEIG